MAQQLGTVAVPSTTGWFTTVFNYRGCVQCHLLAYTSTSMRRAHTHKTHIKSISSPKKFFDVLHHELNTGFYSFFFFFKNSWGGWGANGRNCLQLLSPKTLIARRLSQRIQDETGEVVQQSRALTALPRTDLGSIPGTQRAAYSCL